MDPSLQAAPRPALEILDLTKAYRGVAALRGVSFSVLPGEIHALVGENGAGKSTLVKIVAGATTPDSGTVRLAGEEIESFSPREARARGIAVIHQERQVAPDLSVVENVLLGRLPAGPFGRVDWRAAKRTTEALLAALEADVDLDARVRDLSAAHRQMLEIARALHVQARVILMDEPTSSLGPAESRALFAAARRLRASGTAILFVSHHLEEVLDLADRVTVLRDGQLVTTIRPAEVDKRRLAELMIGRPLPERARVATGQRANARPVTLSLRNVEKWPGLRPTSLEIGAGEIVGVVGLVGSGRRELARVAAGMVAPDAGSVEVLGFVPRSPEDAVRLGVAFLSDDRRSEAILPGQTTADNIVLGPLVHAGGWYSGPQRRRELARSIAASLGIAERRLDDPIETLSGGNQQKALLARWTAVNAKLYVLDEPTVGVDVGARAEIYDILRRQAGGGAAVLFFSSDHEEVRELAHRVVVLRGGEISAELVGDDISIDRLVALQHAVA